MPTKVLTKLKKQVGLFNPACTNSPLQLTLSIIDQF